MSNTASKNWDTAKSEILGTILLLRRLERLVSEDEKATIQAVISHVSAAAIKTTDHPAQVFVFRVFHKIKDDALGLKAHPLTDFLVAFGQTNASNGNAQEQTVARIFSAYERASAAVSNIASTRASVKRVIRDVKSYAATVATEAETGRKKKADAQQPEREITWELPSYYGCGEPPVRGNKKEIKPYWHERHRRAITALSNCALEV